MAWPLIEAAPLAAHLEELGDLGVELEPYEQV